MQMRVVLMTCGWTAKGVSCIAKGLALIIDQESIAACDVQVLADEQYAHLGEDDVVEHISPVTRQPCTRTVGAWVRKFTTK
jgi:hypothetical protein